MTEPLEQVAPLVAERYRLHARIGEGGMAEVWHADDVRLARPVAIKLLTLFVGDETEEERIHRFLREARIAAAVRHPNVVDVLDFGTSEEGRPFMAMELLEGESLEQRLGREPRVTLAEIVDVVLGALDGLGAVHRAGVVHRDLKPDNIFLHDEGGTIRPKVLDFGVSRALGGMAGPRSVLTTMQGRLVGTPEYMSPEQARGHADVDARSDLYSLGVILYETLTGRLPYEGPALGDLIIAVAAGGAPPAHALRPAVGAAISAVIERAMQVRREDRWQSADEMRSALAEAATAVLGREVRASLPALALNRLERRPALSGVATVTRTPYVRAAASLLPPAPPKLHPRTAWTTALVALAGVVVAGLAIWISTDSASPESASPSDDLRVSAVASGPPTRGAMEHDAGSVAPVPAGRSSVPGGADPWHPAPRAARQVHVELQGLPRGARVIVDGETVRLAGSAVELARDGAAHRIVVRKGAARWQVQHLANEDGAYRVRLRRRRPARSNEPAPIAPAQTRRDRSDEPASGGTEFRELDY